MYVAAFANVWNVVMNWFLIFGIGWGYLGAAAARISTQWMMVFCILLYMKVRCPLPFSNSRAPVLPVSAAFKALSTTSTLFLLSFPWPGKRFRGIPAASGCGLGVLVVRGLALYARWRATSSGLSMRERRESQQRGVSARSASTLLCSRAHLDNPLCRRRRLLLANDTLPSETEKHPSTSS